MPEYVCQFCNKYFSRKTVLKAHLLHHEIEYNEDETNDGENENSVSTIII